MDSNYLAVHREILDLREKIIRLRYDLRQRSQDLRNKQSEYSRAVSDVRNAQDEQRRVHLCRTTTSIDRLQARSDVLRAKQRMEDCDQAKYNLSKEVSALERLLHEAESNNDRLE